MVTDLISVILSELGQMLDMELEPDQNNACLIPFGDVKLQLEMAPDGKNFIIGAEVGHVPLGIFREDVFREALRYNGTPPPHVGTFSYSEQKDSLFLIKTLPVEGLTGEKVSTYVPLIADKAKKWKEAIANGQVPEGIEEDESAKAPGGLFGLQ